MRQKTAARTRKHQQASSPQQSGLIAGKNNAPQSGTPRCALDNHSHRTTRGSAAGDSPLIPKHTFLIGCNNASHRVGTSRASARQLQPLG